MTVRVLWAQALDNVSPDHIEVVGSPMTRESAVTSVYHVIERGHAVFESQGTKLTVNAEKFVLEIPSESSDHLGRAAPIICYGEIELPMSERLATDLSSAIAAFASRIGRNISAGINDDVARSVVALKKKRKTIARTRKATTILIALVLITVACVIYYAKRSDFSTKTSEQLRTEAHVVGNQNTADRQ